MCQQLFHIGKDSFRLGMTDLPGKVFGQGRLRSVPGKKDLSQSSSAGQAVIEACFMIAVSFSFYREGTDPAFIGGKRFAVFDPQDIIGGIQQRRAGVRSQAGQQRFFPGGRIGPAFF